ncbi:MAG: hypothetical protein WCB44_01700 [Stellaceae bacterium]
METLLLVLDLVGTRGAMAGVKNRLDLFGVLVLSYAAGERTRRLPREPVFIRCGTALPRIS